MNGVPSDGLETGSDFGFIVISLQHEFLRKYQSVRCPQILQKRRDDLSLSVFHLLSNSVSCDYQILSPSVHIMAGRVDNVSASEQTTDSQRRDGADSTPTVSRTISVEEYEAMIGEQCPLPPRRFMYRPSEGVDKWSGVTTAWFYSDAFWIRNEEDRSKIYEVIFEQSSEFKKYRKRVYAMRTVDEYIGHFKLQKSVPIYRMLNSAVNLDFLDIPIPKKSKSQFAGNRGMSQSAVYAVKFMPKWWDRIVFLGVFGRVLLNAFYIIYNFVTIESVPPEYQIFVGVVVGIEAILFLIAFVRFSYNLWSLMSRMCRGDTTHFQTKNVPDHLRQLGSLSVLRYLPNGESVAMFRKRAKEWINEKRANYQFEMKNSHKFRCCVAIRWLVLAVLEVVGPFVAVFSLLFKMAQVFLCIPFCSDSLYHCL